MAHEPTLYLNATIHTFDEQSPSAAAMFVRDGRIVAMGSRESVETQAPAGTFRVDLQGRTVVPGFNDCHCHILSLGLTLGLLDVGADAVRTMTELKQVVRQQAADLASDRWIVGRGYDQNMLAEGRHPTRADLDEAAPHHPVLLYHTSGHVLVCNSRALTLAGLSANSADPPGGEIDRDVHGEPSGLLKESPAMDLVARLLPPPALAEAASAIEAAMNLMARFGITSATDAATGQWGDFEPELAAYCQVAKSGRLSGRIGLLPKITLVAPPGHEDARRPEEFRPDADPDWLAVCGTKIFADGAMSTRTAALRSPYLNEPANRGILLWESADLTDMMRRAHEVGWQIATHALGDRAVETVLDSYERVLAAKPRLDHRHRIEHCMLADDCLILRIKALGVVPVLQPDIHRLGDGYVTALGLEHAAEVIPMATFGRHRIPVAFSSDAPVIPCNPLEVIRSAIERRTPGGVILGKHHAVSAMQAIRFYTVGSAYATHTDRQKGRLRPGMRADFAVLSRDPATTNIEEWDELRVEQTVVGGETSYRR